LQMNCGHIQPIKKCCLSNSFFLPAQCRKSSKQRHGRSCHAVLFLQACLSILDVMSIDSTV
jgi:hypothetical protein